MATQVLPVSASSTEVNRRFPLAYIVTLAVVALGWIILHIVRPLPKFPLDDPYITLHSAQVLHWGFDPNYPGVSPLFGATSAPFLGLVYLLLFILRPLYAIETACWLGVLAYACGLVYLTRILRMSGFWAAAVIVLGLTCSLVPFHLLNGLETSWAMAAIIWTLALASGKRRLGAALAAGVAAAIRPDLLPFAVFITVALAYEHRAALGTPRSLLVFCCIPFVPVAGCAVWYLAQTGHLYPLTGVAKRYFTAQDHWALNRKVLAEGYRLVTYLLSCGPAAFGLVKARTLPMGKAFIASFLALLISAYVQFPDAIGLNGFRYIVVLTPAVVWALAITSQRGGTRLLFASVVYSILITLPITVRAYRDECAFYDASIHETAKWCNSHLPTNARILVHDAGYIAFATRFRIIDYVGLKTPEAIPLNRRYTWLSGGTDRVDAVSALGVQDNAGYLITLAAQPQTKLLASEMSRLGWKVESVHTVGLYWVYRISR